jgi:hypothetical protein
MPKHAFRFPAVAIAAIRRHVVNAIEAVDASRYHQEACYTAALVNRLEGTAYEGEFGFVGFHSTVFDDRGRGSAESRLGADHAITATVTDGQVTVRKAILVQAKLGSITELNHAERTFLARQIALMKHLVHAPKVMEIRECDGRRFPAMISGNQILAGEPYVAMDLPGYFTARVTTTLDGCTDPEVVQVVQHSTLPQVDIIAKLHYHG